MDPCPRIERRHDPQAVERIVRSLPDWFGIEESIVEYAADAARLPSYLAIEGDEVVGIALVHRRYPESAELHLIAVAPAHHGPGVGTALLEADRGDRREDGVEACCTCRRGPVVRGRVLRRDSSLLREARLLPAPRAHAEGRLGRADLYPGQAPLTAWRRVTSSTATAAPVGFRHAARQVRPTGLRRWCGIRVRRAARVGWRSA